MTTRKAHDIYRKAVRPCVGLAVAVAMALAGRGVAKTLNEVPVSGCANVAYLSDMDGRPWWDAAWRKRAAILVSNMASVRTDRAAVDFVFDVGEAVDPASVRVTTPWETEVPCVASRDGASPTALRLVFLAALREQENRPFFVYWDNPSAPSAPPARTRGAFALKADADEVFVDNGCVTAVFDNLHRTSGFLRALKANVSPHPSLLWRTTGFAWEGFSFETEKTKPRKAAGGKVRPGNALDAQIHKPDAEGGWSPAIVTCDSALKKTVSFTNACASVDFTFYAGVPYVCYAYRLAEGLTSAAIGMSWACGGGTAHDDFFYPGLKGLVLTQRAALDHVTDCEQVPLERWSFPYFGKGWYAFADRRSRDVVGMVFDRDSFLGPSYLAGATHCGETARMRFRHRPAKGACASGSGALVVTVGDYKAVEDVHELLTRPPRVFVAAVQPYRADVLKPRDLAHDFCANYNVGGWRSGTPLPGDEWASNIVTHLRARGASAVLLGQLTDFNWTELPVPRDLYDRTCAFMAKRKPTWKPPAWDGKNFRGDRLRRLCEIAHAKGMAVCTWHGSLPGVNGHYFSDPYDREFWELSNEFQALYPACGVDSVFLQMGGGEGAPLPDEVRNKYGREYWKWENPGLYLDLRKEVGAFLKEACEHSHRVSPRARVMIFNSDNDELGRDLCMSYYPGATDTLFCEFVADGDVDRIKHIAKRLRGYFDNEAGRTVHAHYYCMKLDYANRISQNELPFICGINAFSNEAMTYENVEPENSQFQADFYRLAEHTRLGAKAAKMAPAKYLAVLRDMRCFEEDLFKRRTCRQAWFDASVHDTRVKALSRLPSLSVDVAISPHFTARSLGRYKAVYLVDDDVFSDALAKELLAFVRAGGGAVLEGGTAESCATLRALGLRNGVVTPCGKGKVVRVDDVLSDRVTRRDAKAGDEIRRWVAAVGGEDPLAISNAALDGVLQESGEGRFLGVYNRAQSESAGKVTLRGLKAGAPLFVLDVRRGTRRPYADGFEIAVGPRQCGFYLIGDDAFTALPVAREAGWTGATAASAFPAGEKPKETADAAFEPRHVVEFVTPGPGALIERSEKAGLVRHRFCADEATVAKRAKGADVEDWLRRNAEGVRCYTPSAFARAADVSAYVHIQTDSDDCDAIFADCKESLKALLKRGGGILFSRTKPGPNACRFLAEVGVFNPWPSTKEGFQEPSVWSPSVPTNHPFCSAVGTWYNKNVGSSRKFAKWDVEKQYAPYVDKLQNEYALMVVQENVLGAGKVIFSHNRYCFTSWYENMAHGDAVLSFLLGMPLKEHAEMLVRKNGGPGRPVR